MELEDLTTRDDFGIVVDAMGLTNSGLELGVAFGQNAEQILKKSKHLSMLILVDPWDYVPGQNSRGFGDAIKDFEGCRKYYTNVLRPFERRITIMHADSRKSASLIADGSLDFVYIDGNHMSPFVDEDLKLWWPKVRTGGIFGGHDYMLIDTPVYRCDVKTAVD